METAWRFPPLGASATSLRQPLNIMFDSPRYSSKLANLLEAAGGVDLMVMSHAATHGITWLHRTPFGK